MPRDRHSKKEYESLLREAEERGWLVQRGKGYFKAKCPCDEKRYVSVPLTPSGRRTLVNTRKMFERAQCWKELE